ncbi:conserved Plasmodium protein, unknown function [Plasmodium malariae]|uniref:Uncharacterized protein n=1 Tax=Plasmodium malariae TaxID=5858 RepID=A0A1D3SPG6_PLAMA|nr:conserved Plasmodium protein, unknown function [Plasmodium malariae]SCO93804.1 conserved Plasmodium protein, unknown function [Plasmodium malariae]
MMNGYLRYTISFYVFNCFSFEKDLMKFWKDTNLLPTEDIVIISLKNAFDKGILQNVRTEVERHANRNRNGTYKFVDINYDFEKYAILVMVRGKLHKDMSDVYYKHVNMYTKKTYGETYTNMMKCYFDNFMRTKMKKHSTEEEKKEDEKGGNDKNGNEKKGQVMIVRNAHNSEFPISYKVANPKNKILQIKINGITYMNSLNRYFEIDQENKRLRNYLPNVEDKKKGDEYDEQPPRTFSSGGSNRGSSSDGSNSGNSSETDSRVAKKSPVTQGGSSIVRGKHVCERVEASQYDDNCVSCLTFTIKKVSFCVCISNMDIYKYLDRVDYYKYIFHNYEKKREDRGGNIHLNYMKYFVDNYLLYCKQVYNYLLNKIIFETKNEDIYLFNIDIIILLGFDKYVLFNYKKGNIFNDDSLFFDRNIIIMNQHKINYLQKRRYFTLTMRKRKEKRICVGFRVSCELFMHSNDTASVKGSAGLADDITDNVDEGGKFFYKPFNQVERKNKNINVTVDPQIINFHSIRTHQMYQTSFELFYDYKEKDMHISNTDSSKCSNVGDVVNCDYYKDCGGEGLCRKKEVGRLHVKKISTSRKKSCKYDGNEKGGVYEVQNNKEEREKRDEERIDERSDERIDKRSDERSEKQREEKKKNFNYVRNVLDVDQVRENRWLSSTTNKKKGVSNEKDFSKSGELSLEKVVEVRNVFQKNISNYSPHGSVFKNSEECCYKSKSNSFDDCNDYYTTLNTHSSGTMNIDDFPLSDGGSQGNVDTLYFSILCFDAKNNSTIPVNLYSYMHLKKNSIFKYLEENIRFKKEDIIKEKKEGNKSSSIYNEANFDILRCIYVYPYKGILKKNSKKKIFLNLYVEHFIKSEMANQTFVLIIRVHNFAKDIFLTFNYCLKNTIIGLLIRDSATHTGDGTAIIGDDPVNSRNDDSKNNYDSANNDKIQMKPILPANFTKFVFFLFFILDNYQRDVSNYDEGKEIDDVFYFFRLSNLNNCHLIYYISPNLDSNNGNGNGNCNFNYPWKKNFFYGKYYEENIPGGVSSLNKKRFQNGEEKNVYIPDEINYVIGKLKNSEKIEKIISIEAILLLCEELFHVLNKTMIYSNILVSIKTIYNNCNLNENMKMYLIFCAILKNSPSVVYKNIFLVFTCFLKKLFNYFIQLSMHNFYALVIKNTDEDHHYNKICKKKKYINYYSNLFLDAFHFFHTSFLSYVSTIFLSFLDVQIALDLAHYLLFHM